MNTSFRLHSLVYTSLWTTVTGSLYWSSTVSWKGQEKSVFLTTSDGYLTVIPHKALSRLRVRAFRNQLKVALTLCYVRVVTRNTMPWGRAIARCLCDKRLNVGTELDFASWSWFKNNSVPCQRGLPSLLPSLSQVELIKLSGTALTLVSE